MPHKEYRKSQLFILTILCTFFFATSTQASSPCTYNGSQFTLSHAPTTEMRALYRLYNTRSGVHLYTRGAPDANAVIRKWPEFEFTDSKPSFCAFPATSTNTTPIYRLYNTRSGVHLYTRGVADRDSVMKKWPEFEFTDGSPAFYAYLTEKPNTTPIYRLYNTRSGVHLYTRGVADRDSVMKKWPEFEFTDGSPAFYAYLTDDAGPDIVRPLQDDLGPMIAVGLSEYTRDFLEDNAITISSVNHDYKIIKRRLDEDGDTEDTIIMSRVDADDETEITYDSDGKLIIHGAASGAVRGEKDDIIFLAADDNDANTIIFETNRDSTYDTFRYNMRIRYADKDEGANAYECANHDSKRCIWLINDLPLELYTWGMGEITGTAADIADKYDEGMQYNKMMTTIYRSYGLYKITESTEHKSKGFDTVPDPSDQIYRGYVWEKKYPHIPTAAKETRGKIVTYDDEPILTPFGSWTDGHTRHFRDGHFNGVCKTSEQKKESDVFPYLLSVDDEPGEHPTNSTCSLAAAGNHMVGISAQGSLGRALDDEWAWERITKHYLSEVDIDQWY